MLYQGYAGRMRRYGGIGKGGCIKHWLPTRRVLRKTLGIRFQGGPCEMARKNQGTRKGPENIMGEQSDLRNIPLLSNITSRKSQWYVFLSMKIREHELRIRLPNHHSIFYTTSIYLPHLRKIIFIPPIDPSIDGVESNFPASNIYIWWRIQNYTS